MNTLKSWCRAAAVLQVATLAAVGLADTPRLGVNYLGPCGAEYTRMVREKIDVDETIAIDVAHWRRLGLKLMRIHFLDVQASTKDGSLVENEHIAALDRLVYECGRNGIGVMLTPIAWWNSHKRKDGFSDYYDMPAMTTNLEARAAQVKFLSEFAAHRNRLNGLRYADDPAVVGFECINEPVYPNRPRPRDGEITAYMDALAAGVRSSGTKKPVFYNCWCGGDRAAAASTLDGVSGNFYPNGGHGAMRTVLGPMLGIVNGSTIPTSNPTLNAKRKLVYEFDSADIRSAYMFPAMAKAMRAEGIDYAAHFNYDALPFADENWNTLSHYLNLVYTPEVALSMAIAQEIFAHVPAGTPYRRTTGTIDFPPFKIDERRNTSEMVTATDYLYANGALTDAPMPELLKRVWGRGKSSVVTSSGNGAYFFDKVGSGVWRLQLYPSVRALADPHIWKRYEKKAAVLGDTIALTVALPDLGASFGVWATDDGRQIGSAEAGAVRLAPGDYVLARSADGLPCGRAFDLPRYYAPKPVANPGPEWRVPTEPKTCLKLESPTFKGRSNVAGDIVLDGESFTAAFGRTPDEMRDAKIVLRVKGLQPATTAAEISIYHCNQFRWTQNIPVTMEEREVELPLRDFVYRGSGKQPICVPDLNCARKLTVMIGQWLYPEPAKSQPHGLVITGVRLETGMRSKIVLGSGWDINEATTEEVWRNRAKFARTGLDGILLRFNRTDANGKVVGAGCDVLEKVLWRDADFERSKKLLADCVATPGLRESLALEYLIPRKRIDWRDDEGWRIAANNIARLARAAKDCRLKGFAIDIEDYYKQRQFRLNPEDGDFDAACRLARRRGRAFWGALFGEYPNVHLLFMWMFSEWRDVVRSRDPISVGRTYMGGDLWPSFLNGLLDVLPPEAHITDGNETNGYKTDVRRGNFQTGGWESLRAVLPLVAPENRSTYLSRVAVSFGIYIDSYVQPDGGHWAYPALGGSRAAACRQNVLAASDVADECIWVYGEEGTWIDWEAHPHAKLRKKTWEAQLPGFSETMRMAANRLAVLRKKAARGHLSTNLVTVGESADGKLPPGISTWTKSSLPSDKEFFHFDPDDGATHAGCLKLTGAGTFMAFACGLKPGETVYVRLKVKGKTPSVGVAWRRGNAWDWSHGVNLLAPSEKDPSVWRTVDGVFLVPEGIDGIGVTLSGNASESDPVRFDDIEIRR